MASNTFSLEDSLKTLRKEGFLVLNDSEVGELVSEMERRRFPFLSAFGLRYCKRHVFDNEVKMTSLTLWYLSKFL